MRARFPSAPLFAIGWSLGANILVNYLGEEGAAGRAPLDAAASMCNPFDLVTCDIALESGMVRHRMHCADASADAAHHYTSADSRALAVSHVAGPRVFQVDG